MPFSRYHRLTKYQTLDKYKLAKIPLENEESIKWLITRANNWFSSAYVKDRFFHQVRPNKLFKRYKDENSLLYSESNKLSDNFIIILSLLEFDKLSDKQQIKECISSILNALDYVKELRRSCNKDYLLDFICKNIKLLDDWHISLVFKFAFYESKWTKQNIFVNFTYRFGEFVGNDKLGIKTRQYLLENPKTPDIFKWILDPQSFNYKKFNCYWAIVFNKASILEKLDKLNIIHVKNALYK